MCADGSSSLDLETSDLQMSDLGSMEQEWLQLVRLHCVSFEHNRLDGWDRAVTHAEDRYGSDNGPVIACRVGMVIRAMRTERQGGFGYLSPFCSSCRQRVTQDEWHLISLMQAGYRGRSQEIADAAASFARRDEAHALATAAARFGTSLAAAVGSHRTWAASSLMRH
jgi:hypothetical protein